MTALLLTSSVSEWTHGVGGLISSPMVALVDGAVRAVLVAGVVWAGLRLLGARNVVAQKAAWGLVLAGALLMPIVVPWAAGVAWLPEQARLVVPAYGWLQGVGPRSESQRPATDAVAMRHAVPDTAVITVQGSPVAAEPVPQVDRLRAPNPGSAHPDRFPAPTISNSATPGTEGEVRPFSTGRRLFLPVSDMAWLLYGSVCVALLLRLFYGLGAAADLWQTAEPIEIEPASVSAGMRLRCSHRISSPVTVGSGVVFPADYDEWDAEKLRIVLAHERSHVRQGDFYLQALAGLYTALFWFSPLGWWLKRKLSDLSEAISDRAGLQEAASHASYAQILLEFAALPRRTQIGVAMARSGRLSQRIERLLNENHFRQAFAGGRRRVLAALLLVPVALFAAAALIRVEAAQTMQRPAVTQGAVIMETHPQAEPATDEQMTLAVDAQAPAAPPAPASAPAPPAPNAPAPADAPEAAPAPEAPEAPPAAEADNAVTQDQEENATAAQCNSNSHSNSRSESQHRVTRVSSRHGYSYSYDSNGDSYALISGNNKNHVQFSGDWYDGRRADLDKARAVAHGDFLWFTRNGKSYVVDDPQTIARIQAMYRPMEDLGRQQEELGRKQEELGKQQEELGRQQEEASIPTPDISKEMADLNAAVARLQAKKNGTVTQEQLADLEGTIGELQGKLGGLQGEVGAKQGELGRKQGLLGEQQGKLGAQQGRLGEEQGRIAREADQKVKSIIDESLKDGKAKPVE
jgi:BlaR1 peptidase M56